MITIQTITAGAFRMRLLEQSARYYFDIRPDACPEVTAILFLAHTEEHAKRLFKMRVDRVVGQIVDEAA